MCQARKFRPLSGSDAFGKGTSLIQTAASPPASWAGAATCECSRVEWRPMSPGLWGLEGGDLCSCCESPHYSTSAKDDVVFRLSGSENTALIPFILHRHTSIPGPHCSPTHPFPLFLSQPPSPVPYLPKSPSTECQLHSWAGTLPSPFLYEHPQASSPHFRNKMYMYTSNCRISSRVTKA